MNSLVKKAYIEASATIDKIKQVIMLYEGAIVALQQAKAAIEEKDYETKFNKVEKAYKIVSALRDALDFESSEEISGTLAQWYDGVILRIISINNSEDAAMCDVCIKNLREMKETWEEAEVISAEEGQETVDENAIKVPVTTTSLGELGTSIPPQSGLSVSI